MISSRRFLLNSNYAFRYFSTFIKPLTIHDYYDNLSHKSAFLKDIAVVMQAAETHLSTRIHAHNANPSSYKLAVTLDIDDTSISHYGVFKKNNFYINPAVIESCYQEAASPAIQPVLNFYKTALKGNVSIFFITARKPVNPNTDLRSVTETNLRHTGFGTYSGLFLPQGNDASLPTTTFKTRIRQQLEAEGQYKIILNIGDQQSDLDGGYSEKTIKLPNYLYDFSKYTATSSTNNLPQESVKSPKPFR